jgi:hypothetical protein
MAPHSSTFVTVMCNFWYKNPISIDNPLQLIKYSKQEQHHKMESAFTQIAEEMACLLDNPSYNLSIDTSHNRKKQKQIFIVSCIWCCQPALKESCE